MNRRALFITACAGAIASALPRLSAATQASEVASVPMLGKPVKPPGHGPLRVAFVVGPETVLIDVAGPWSAFSNAMVAVEPYTVAPSKAPADLEGVKVVPDYTFENAPQPNVVVVPATKNLPESIAWVKKMSARADITMSVCVGAFLVAKTGLFNGVYATTHHGAYDQFAREFPQVKLVRGPRFVEDRDVSSAGGETSGIDLGLRVVERYYGKSVADEAARNMEYVTTRRPTA